MISAKMGHKLSVQLILEWHQMGGATQEEYAQALHGYRHATEEMC